MLSLHALNASDGTLRWRSPISREAFRAPTYVSAPAPLSGVYAFPVLGSSP